MLIDATHPEETRVVVADGNKVDDFDFESINKRQLAGNIYLAKITRVEPSLQAAFVDYGGNRHGFLAFSEIHPDYYQIPIADREALLAEEERAAREDEKSDDEASEPKSAKKPRRSRTSRRSKTKGAESATEIAGLEVISVASDSNETADAAVASESLAVVDPVAEAEPAAREPSAETVDENAGAKAEPADAPPTETTSDAAQEASADPDTSGESEPANEASDTAETDETATAVAETADSKPPKSIAESSGLDEDSVSEDIVEAGSETTARKPSDDDKAAASDPAPAEPASPSASDTDSEETVAESVDAPEEATTEPVETPDEAESAQAGEEPAAPETDGSDEKPRKRSRRSRRKKPSEKAEKEAGPVDDENGSETNGSNGDSVESVGAEDLQEEVASARARRRRSYKIQDVVKVRQIMLVQVVKEERGNKGAALTTYLSLAGRYCVLMPNTGRGGGISRKITQAGDRKRLREIVDELDVPKGMGLIVRTAGAERTRAEIKRDYEFLSRQWERVRDLTLKSIAPTLIYEEGSLIKRSIRDLYSKDIDSILVEGDTGYREAKDYMKMLMPSHAKNVQQYVDPIPLYVRYQVESYLNGMFSPTVQLKSGGYIVIGVTEALVAVDVNSGRATKQGSIEETALQTNLEAADEVARQCRLRDLAGLIVIDFIDMEENRNNRAVEKRMKDRLKNDRARIQIGRISSFGLMEMSRQRLRPGMLEATTSPCPHCHGMGVIRSDENMALSILREVEEEGIRGRSAEITVNAPIDVANFLLNHKREHIARIEERSGVSIMILGDPSLTSPDFKVDRSKHASKVVAKVTDAVTADSVVTSDDVIEVPESDEKPEAPPANPDDKLERDGKSRRRRGKRGGRRRRNSESGDEQRAEGEDTAGDGIQSSRDDTDPQEGNAATDTVEEAPSASTEQAEPSDPPQPNEPEPEVPAEPESQAEEVPASTADGTETSSDDVVEPEATPETAEDDDPADTPVPAEPGDVGDPVVEEAASDKPKRRGWWSIRS
ncbi:MAG: Rne/Rng family ribonuclease [Pseudomonadota bacterium]